MTMDRLNKTDMQIIRESIIEALTIRTTTTCPKCGENVSSDHIYKLERLVDAYGDPSGLSLQHVDCNNPNAKSGPTMQANVDKHGRKTILQRELMKDGPALNKDDELQAELDKRNDPM